MRTTVRAAIEDEYARKLLAICRKPLGAGETGTLRTSFDVVRGETESIAKAHSAIASQMKRELEEPLVAFAGGIKERRKIIQTGIERLHKTKVQQTQTVNKVSSVQKYRSEGYLAVADSRSLRTRLSKDQGISCSGTYGYGPRGAEK